MSDKIHPDLAIPIVLVRDPSQLAKLTGSHRENNPKNNNTLSENMSIS